jgi:uncharacterized membrane protein YhaH (DUF805 family)
MHKFLESWFPFHGRIGPRKYWIATLLYALVWLLGTLILVILASLNYNPPNDTITNSTIVGFVLLSVAMIVFSVTIAAGLASTGVRRLHDRGKSGYWLILYYVLPSMLARYAGSNDVGLILWLVILGILIWTIIDLGVLPGEVGSNAFGSEPS